HARQHHRAGTDGDAVLDDRPRRFVLMTQAQRVAVVREDRARPDEDVVADRRVGRDVDLTLELDIAANLDVTIDGGPGADGPMVVCSRIRTWWPQRKCEPMMTSP